MTREAYQHSHEASAGCEHEHRHGHEGCGHEHRHEHEGCGHEHQHELPPTGETGAGTVNIHTHDGAVVATLEYVCDLPASRFDEAHRQLKQRLEKLGSWVTEQGGIIGHIKASVEQRLVGMYSFTDQEVNYTEAAVQSWTVTIAAIVYLVEEHLLKEYMEEVFSEGKAEELVKMES